MDHTPVAKGNSNVEIQSRADMGRVLVATKDFKEGDLVLEEAPLLHIKRNVEEGRLPVMAAFAEATRDVKEKVVTLFAYPDPHKNSSNTTIRELRETLQKLGAPKAKEDALLELILIERVNAHWYLDEDRALFEIGSKAAHSCCPNVTYNSSAEKGLIYRALRPIAKGDLITMSYLSPRQLMSPIVLRRHALWVSKFFKCLCARCSKPDDCRVLMCVDEACKGDMRHCPDADENARWWCEKCDKRYSGKEETFQKPTLMERTLEQVVSDLDEKPDQPPEFIRDTPNWPVHLMTMASGSLSPQHWLVNLINKISAEYYIALNQHEDAFPHIANYWSFGLEVIQQPQVVVGWVAGVLRGMENFDALVPRICEIYDRLAGVLLAVWGKEDIDYRHCEQFVLDFVKKQKEREIRSASKKAEEEEEAKHEEKEDQKEKKRDEQKREESTPSVSSPFPSSPLSSSNLPSSNSLRLCGLCEATALHRCSRCKAVYYCSAAHQKEHWKSHKIVCKPIY